MGETDNANGPLTPHSEPDERTRHHPQEELLVSVTDKAARKLLARRTQDKSVWFGLGMFGMIGWSVAVPTLLALALGIWLDHHWPVRFSWTLTLLFLGIVLGCLNAWFWVIRERAPIERKLRPPDVAQTAEQYDTTEGQEDG